MMSSLTAPGPPPATSEVLVTEELDRRPARAADFQGENRALLELTRVLQDPGANALQELAQTALRLCRAHSAAVGIVEGRAGLELVRWQGAAGQCFAFVGEAMARDTSLLGAVLERNIPLLMTYPERRFACCATAAPPLVEVLLVPLRSEGEAVGAICVMAHDDSRRFDREDLRLLSSLSECTSITYQVLQQTEGLRDALAQERTSSRLLQEVSVALIHENDVSLLFGQILDAAIALMRADFGSLQIIQGSTGDLQLLAWRGFHPRTARFWRRVNVHSGSATGRALYSKRRLVIGDTERSDLLVSSAEQEEYRRSGIRSVQATPLPSRAGSVVGVLSTHWREPHEPTAAELRFFDVLARLAADLLERTKTEERQAFLLKLSDALRPLGSPLAVQECAAKLLGEHLRVHRAAFAAMEANGGFMSVASDWRLAGAPSLKGRHHVDALGKLLRRPLHEGGVSIIEDALRDPPVPQERSTDPWGVIHARAAVSYGLVKQGRFVGAIIVDQKTPRLWTENEIAIVREVGERTWEAVERARTEVALRDSEERFRQFANASSDALWIRDVRTLVMEYVSPAVETVYGVSSKQLLGDVKLWAALLLPEDRALALERLEQARTQPVVHEFRIQRPSDRSFRWMRSTEFPLFDEHGAVQRVAGIVSDITEVRRSAEHQAVLVSELQHRVRNLMALIRSIAGRTAGSAQSVSDYEALLSGRLLTLARVQTLLTRAANEGAGIRAILQDQLSALAHSEDHFEIVGDDVVVSPKAAEVITLAIHELITNALKYGALSDPDGRIRVTWKRYEDHGTAWLALDWVEHAGRPATLSSAPRSRRRGFGTELIEDRVPYELGGQGSLKIENDGARCHLAFPLEERASILKTDAPRNSQVDGGTLDMRGAPDLTAQRILIVEDDYYLAMDAARAIRGAGAEVLGPCSTEMAAREEMKVALPTGVLLDVNLGLGPSFKLARSLRDCAIPLVFITGYTDEAIPPDLTDVTRLEKPVELRRIVGTLAGVVGAA